MTIPQAAGQAIPPLTEVVMVCLGCHHWQLDFHPDARRMGDRRTQFLAAAEAHAKHLDECVGAEGRIKVLDRWVDRPHMKSGKRADGVLGAVRLPRWWTWY